MKNIYKSLFIFLIITSLLASCSPPELEASNERRILEISANGQIGRAKLPTALEQRTTAEVLFREGSADFSKLMLNIVISPGATITPDPNTPLDFASNGNQHVFKVTSSTGVTDEWTVKVATFANPLRGTWKVEKIEFYHNDYQGYGNQGTKSLRDKIDAAVPAYDDIITMSPIVNVTPQGNVYGTYERTAGADTQFASYVASTGKDYAYKFDRISPGTGRWLLNSDNTITFTDSKGTSRKGKGYETPDPNTLIIRLDPGPFDTPWVIDWGNYWGNPDNSLNFTEAYWYTLKRQ